MALASGATICVLFPSVAMARNYLQIMSVERTIFFQQRHILLQFVITSLLLATQTVIIGCKECKLWISFVLALTMLVHTNSDLNYRESPPKLDVCTWQPLARVKVLGYIASIALCMGALAASCIEGKLASASCMEYPFAEPCLPIFLAALLADVVRLMLVCLVFYLLLKPLLTLLRFLCAKPTHHQRLLDEQDPDARSSNSPMWHALQSVLAAAHFNDTANQALNKARELEQTLQTSRLWYQYAGDLVDDAAVRKFFKDRQNSLHGKGQLQLDSISKVENENALRSFIPSHSNDQLLFHGTSEDAVGNISTTGLTMKYANPAGMLGSGIYGAPDPRKAEKYAKKTRNGRFIFICRFNLTGMSHAGPSTSHRNTVFDEYCIYERNQVVVLWMLKLK